MPNNLDALKRYLPPIVVSISNGKIVVVDIREESHADFVDIIVTAEFGGTRIDFRFGRADALSQYTVDRMAPAYANQIVGAIQAYKRDVMEILDQ